MSYLVKPDVFVRYEKDLPDDNVFIFIGSTNDMYQANKEVYDIIELIRKKNSIEDMVEKLSATYTNSSKSEILSGLNEILANLNELGVIQTI